MLFKALLNMGTLPLANWEGYQSGQMGRAVNPLTSVFEGSNPSPSTINKILINIGVYTWVCGCSSVVEH